MSTATAAKITAPADGAKMSISNGRLVVPDNPIVPFIEGDGTGPDIWREVYAGEKSNKLLHTWLPDETVAACRDYLVSIKGPLTTPVGGGIRSLNVALRQLLDLYACVRPVKYYQGVPSPVKHPEKVDIVIFRENTEDVYSGIEFKQGSADAGRIIEFINEDL